MDLIKNIKDVIGSRKIAINGVPGVYKSTEKWVSDNIGPIDAYFTAKGLSDNTRVFGIKNINRDVYFLFIPDSVFCDDKKYKYFESLGLERKRDYFDLSHKAISQYDSDNSWYGNEADVKSPVKVLFSGYNSRVEIGENVRFPKNFVIKIGSDSELVVGSNTIFEPSSFVMKNQSVLRLGDNCIFDGLKIFINSMSKVDIGKGSTFQSGRLRTGRNSVIKIGEDCMASWDVVFLPRDGHLIWDVETEKPLNNTDEVNYLRVGNHCWLGGESVLAQGTDLGSGSIVGYRSFVNNKFTNNVVVAGTPARVIKKNIAWSRKNYSENYSEDYLAIPEEYRKATIEGLIIPEK